MIITANAKSKGTNKLWGSSLIFAISRFKNSLHFEPEYPSGQKQYGEPSRTIHSPLFSQ